MEKLTILTLEEGSRLEWQESLTGYFRESGDYTAYLMPPCIMLPEERDIREWFDIGDGIFTLSGPIGRVSSFWCMRIDDSRLPQGSGMFLSAAGEEPMMPPFAGRKLKVKAIASAETDGTFFRITAHHPLKRGI